SLRATYSSLVPLFTPSTFSPKIATASLIFPQKFFTSGHCQSRWIRVPVMPQPCQHKSEALQFILYIFCGVMYDLNRILSCISFMVSHSSSVILSLDPSPIVP
uniref:Uncharacterized protein n=1 Tax=Neogobius melanostomus TaxID=47308 RepID=A0A8C6SCY7_9GOBI